MKYKGFSGTWKLNLERSDIPPVTKSQIVTIETDGNSVNMLEEIARIVKVIREKNNF